MLLDVHTHLGSYTGTYQETALAEIRQMSILSVSSCHDLPCHRRTTELAERCPLVIPAFGIHPRHAHDYINRLETIDNKAREALFIGEIGLDGDSARISGNGPQQKMLFKFFLERAIKYDKPVIIHCRGAEAEALELLEEMTPPRVIIHWYSGPIDVFRQMAALEYKFSIGLMVMHSDFVRVIARRIQKEQLLLETDNPSCYEKIGKKPGMPHLIIDIKKEVARLRNQSHQEIEQINWENFMNLLTPGERSHILKRIRGNS